MSEENKIIFCQDDNEIPRVSVRYADEDLWMTPHKEGMHPNSQSGTLANVKSHSITAEWLFCVAKVALCVMGGSFA